ncbi:MAG TPA: aminotransferase class V-fold PLP-dependent enzyme, partial [Bacteroidales bacterium]|nr:aminotransferase class V-fold PLP-dependent enzyme [Bacteroidales bacterium]
LWGKLPDKLEPGTPALLNIIAFAKALLIVQQSGYGLFTGINGEERTGKQILEDDELNGFHGKELLQKLREMHLGGHLAVPVTGGRRNFVNLDNSASTPTFIPVWEAFRQALHQSAATHTQIINETRKICSEFLNAPLAEYDLLFTSNTTESVNLVAESMSKDLSASSEPVILSSYMEHSSNDLPWRRLPGHTLIRLQENEDGFLDLNELETLLQWYNGRGCAGNKRIKLVSVTGASNVLGSCINIEEVSRIVHRLGARLLIDAAQLVSHRKIDVAKWGIDYLVLSAHKAYAPFGSGMLVAIKGALNFTEEEMLTIRSSGEENAAGIAAMGKALLFLQRIGMDKIEAEEKELTRYALNELSVIPGLRIFGVQNADSAGFENKIGVIPVIMKQMMSDKLAKALAEQGGIGVRFGCHCAHMIVKRLLNVGPVLERFQQLILTLFPKVQLPGLLRISLGIENTKEDIDVLISVLREIGNNHGTGRNEEFIHDDKGKNHLSEKKIKNRINEFVRSRVQMVYSD